MSVRILTPGDEAALEEFLLPRADASMFLLSNVRAAGLGDRGAAYQGTYAAWFDDGRIAAVAGHVWNRNLILQAPVRTAEVVREAVARSRRPVGGFVGPSSQVEDARRALGLGRAATQYESTEDRFALGLDEMRMPPALADGALRCRLAGESDLELLARWRMEFAVETLGAVDGPDARETNRQNVARQAKARQLFVLEGEGGAVSTTAFNAWAPPAAQVGGVYTPPAGRGRGYARAAVAGSLLWARGEGVTRAVLFTGNPLARRAYEAIGFRRIGDYRIVLLARPAEPFAAVDPR